MLNQISSSNTNLTIKTAVNPLPLSKKIQAPPQSKDQWLSMIWLIHKTKDRMQIFIISKLQTKTLRPSRNRLTLIRVIIVNLWAPIGLISKDCFLLNPLINNITSSNNSKIRVLEKWLNSKSYRVHRTTVTAWWSAKESKEGNKPSISCRSSKSHSSKIISVIYARVTGLIISIRNWLQKIGCQLLIM